MIPIFIYKENLLSDAGLSYRELYRELNKSIILFIIGAIFVALSGEK